MIASRLVPDGGVEPKISGCKYYFREFQLELDSPRIKNFKIGSVDAKLQSWEVGLIFDGGGTKVLLFKINYYLMIYFLTSRFSS